METLSSKILASSQQYNSNEGMANSSAKDPEFDYFDGRP